MFNDKTILITGGTGSFGKTFISYLLKNYNPKKIIVFSRDEMKQWNLRKNYENESRLRFLIGDVRDYSRIERATYDVDMIVHAAAMKIVPTIERDPFECIKTNITGAMNVIDAAINNNVSKVIALSTDKASSPINLYGATKLVSDKSFISANQYTKRTNTRFAVVRYGNVMGSRGSVIPFFVNQKQNGLPLTITDKRMSRFMISLDEGVRIVDKAFNMMVGGEIFVKKIPSMNIMDIANAVAPGCKIEFTGIRDGEKLHEEMISISDSLNTYEFSDFFIIRPSYTKIQPDYLKHAKKVPDGFSYTSDNNTEWMSEEELKTWMNSNNLESN